MRKFTGLLVLLGLVAASLLWPESKVEPPADAPSPGAITGRVTLHGCPVVARIEVKKIRDLAPGGNAAREFMHPFRDLRRPLAGRGAPVGTAESDEAGQFRVEGLPPAVYHVTARTAEGATGQWTAEIEAPGQVLRERWDICSTGITLLGRLRWSDGRPFLGQITVGPWSAETSPDGRFVLADLPRHELPIQVYVPGGFSRVIGVFDPTAEGRIDVVVDRGLVPREGRVLSADDGRPLGGITVGGFWREAARRDGVAATVTGPDGTFRVLGHPDDPSFAAAGDEHLWEWVTDTDPGAPLEIRLRRRPVVTGRVVTPDGRPIPGAHVWLFRLSTRGPDGPDRRWQNPVLTDDEGRFRFTSGVTGFAIVAVFGGGYVSRDLHAGRPRGYYPMAIDLSPGETVDRELVAVPSPSLSGRVTDHAGNPVTGMKVYAGEDMDHMAMAGGKSDYQGEEPFAVTGPAGRYRFPTLDPRLPWRVSIYPPDGYTVESALLWPAAGPTADLVLPPPPDRWVEVEVLAAGSDRPIYGASVRMEPADPEDDLPFWIGGSVTTGRDGWARVGPLPPGPLVAGVSHPAHPGRWGIDVPAVDGDGAPEQVTFRLEPGAVLAGRLLLPDGSPAVGAEVTVAHHARRVGMSGRFAFRNLEAGTHEIRAYGYLAGGRYHQARARVDTGRQDIVLTLEPAPGRPPIPRLRKRTDPVPTGRIAGLVLDPAGKPVRGACVAVRPGNAIEEFPPTWPGVRTAVWTDAEGRFAFAAIDDEAQDVRVVGPPHLFLPAAVGAVAGDENVVIRLADAAQPVVTVLDAEGKPVPGVAVELTDPGIGSGEPFVGLVTDHRGQVRFVSLDPERALVLALKPPDDREEFAEAEIDEWAPADTRVRLRRLRTVRGAVRDRDGYPVGNASLWLSAAGDEEREWDEVYVGGDGRFEVEDAPSDVLEFRAGLPRRKLDDPDLVTHPAVPGPVPVEIEIDGGIWIGLHVPGWPADADARVSLAWQGGVRRLVMPESGRVRFHGLPADRDFSLHAGPLPDGRMAFGDDLLPDTDHEIPLRAGRSISGRVLGAEELDWFHISIYGKGIALRYDLPDDAPTDRYRVEGLPEGEYLVTILARSAGQAYKGEIRVRTGEPKELKLEPWK